MQPAPPLLGRRVLLTRQPHQSAELRELLEALGAEVLELPVIVTVPPRDPARLDEALAGLEGYDWVVFTSANAVEAVAARLSARGLRWSERPEVAAVGPATSAVVRDALGGRVALEPAADYRAEGLLAAFEPLALAGRRMLLPLSDRAREALASGLRARGAVVDAVQAYRTVMPPDLPRRLAEVLGERLDLVVFASPSAVEGFRQALAPGAPPPAAAVIGPLTAAAARRAGLEVRAVASPSTAGGMAAAIAQAAPSLTGRG